MSYLLDTKALSEIRRRRDAHVRGWVREVDDIDLYLSVLTLGEIRKGVGRLRGRDPFQAEVFAGWIGGLLERFADRVLMVDARVADEWGRLDAAASSSAVDSLIAATARVHELTIVTRNTADFQACDVLVLNPWHAR